MADALTSESGGFDEKTAERACDEFDRYISKLEADNIDEDKTEVMRTDTVARLLGETRAVQVVDAEESEFIVTLKHDGKERELRFTPGEWANTSPAPFRERYVNQFFDRIDLTKEEWEDLTEAWQEQLEVVATEESTTRERRAERVLDKLGEGLTIYDDRDKLKNGTYSAWYDPSNSAGIEGAGADEPVVLVHNEAIYAVLDELNLDGDSTIADLSTTLNMTEEMYSGTVRRNEGSLWPFKPEAVGLDDPELQVHRPGEKDTVIEP